MVYNACDSILILHLYFHNDDSFSSTKLCKILLPNIDAHEAYDENLGTMYISLTYII